MNHYVLSSFLFYFLIKKIMNRTDAVIILPKHPLPAILEMVKCIRIICQQYQVCVILRQIYIKLSFMNLMYNICKLSMHFSLTSK